LKSLKNYVEKGFLRSLGLLLKPIEDNWEALTVLKDLYKCRDNSSNPFAKRFVAESGRDGEKGRM